MVRVLVVDRSAGTRDTVAELLGELASGVAWATRDAAAAMLRDGIATGRPFDVVLLEADPPPTAHGVRELVTQGGGVRVVLAAHGPEGAAIAARCGASDVVTRPFTAGELAFRVGRGAPTAERTDKRRPRKSDVLIGTGAWIKELYDRIAMVAATDVTVAIFGESGTGKELVARTIHNSSPRHDAPFVVVNCAAIPEALLEDELFGHVRGAFTDATRDREGLLAAAHTGTLFLDEIGELPLTAQAKLLRFLQEGEFRRVGDTVNRSADVRIVSATNRKLESAVEEGHFRDDLYYRVRGVEIVLPPLRERAADIPLLAAHFLAGERARHKGGASMLSPDAEAVFVAYAWPGNVRELQNTIRAAHAMAGDAKQIEIEHLPERLRGVTPSRAAAGSYQDAVTRFKRDLIESSLAQANGNQNRAAAMLKISRQALAYQIRELGILVKNSPQTRL